MTGEIDLDQLASLIDARTKMVCCTGASNFLRDQAPHGGPARGPPVRVRWSPR